MLVMVVYQKHFSSN